jgi:4-nitrophenyl phosphatase
MKKIESIIFDMDGVIWKDQKPLGDLKWVFEQLQKHKIKYAFATNNSTKTPDAYQKKLKTLGIPTNSDQIITSATTLVKIMLEKYPDGGPVFIIGEEGLRLPLLDSGFHPSEEDILAVVGGLDRKINYAKLKQAILFLQKDVDFYYTNSDTTFPTPDGKIPGAGSLLRALEVGSGKKAILAGKPKSEMFEYAISYLETSPQSTLVVGDRLDTDILGGLNAGCLTALVLTGISTLDDIKKNEYTPHLLFTDLTELILFLGKNNWKIEV